MAKFIINKGYGNEETVEAVGFVVNEKWAQFYDDMQNTVYAVPSAQVQSIEKEGVTGK